MPLSAGGTHPISWRPKKSGARRWAGPEGMPENPREDPNSVQALPGERSARSPGTGSAGAVSVRGLSDPPDQNAAGWVPVIALEAAKPWGPATSKYQTWKVKVTQSGLPAGYSVVKLPLPLPSVL